MVIKNNDERLQNIKICGVNNEIYGIDYVPSICNLNISIFGNNNKVYIPKDLKINKNGGGVFININGNNNEIKIGKNVYVNRTLNCIIFKGGIGALSDKCKIVIGDNCFFNGGNISLLCGEMNTHIDIGNDCLFASDITLATSDNHSIFNKETKKRLNYAGNIVIGKHCWICDDVKILNHSYIGDECVIATKALVVSFPKKLFSFFYKKPPNNCIIGGIPARILKKNIVWHREIKEFLE